MIFVYVSKPHCFTHITAKEFKDNFTRRKSSIKLMIQSKLAKLSKAVDGGEEEEKKEALV